MTRGLRTLTIVLLGAFISNCPSSAQSKAITFQDLLGNSFSNVVIIKRNQDSVLFRYGDETRYGTVYFTNMSEAAQLLCGYDAKKLARMRDEEIAKYQKAREQHAAAREQKQKSELQKLRVIFERLNTNDFPKSIEGRAACKEIAAELKGIHTAIGLGVTYGKYSDLLTDAAIRVQKLKDIHGGSIPTAFKYRSTWCIQSFDSARDWWSKKIEAASSSESVKATYEYYVQKEWAEAALHLSFCLGVSESDTNVNERIFDGVFAMVKAEKKASDNGVLEPKYADYSSLHPLSKEELMRRLAEGSD